MSETRDPMLVGMDKIVELCASPGKFVYQYRDSETGFKMLDNQTVRLSPLADFNDPTEAARFEELALDGTSKLGDAWDLLCTAKSMHKNYRAACFSQDRPEAIPIDSPNFFTISDHYQRGYLLQRNWAQYADNHTGMCLVFNKEKLNAVFLKQTREECELLSGPVKYSLTNLPTLLSFTNESPTLLGNGLGEENDALHKYFLRFAEWFFFTKQSDWSSECEYRWVYSSNENLGKPVDLDFGDSIEAVVVGHRFPIDLYAELSVFCTKFRIPCLRVFMMNAMPPVLRPANLAGGIAASASPHRIR